MAVNTLSAEGVLAQWFTPESLGEYAAAIGKSRNGNAATLAARIATAWAHPSFEPPHSSRSGDGGTATAAPCVADGDTAAPPAAKKVKISAASLAELADSDSSSDDGVPRQTPPITTSRDVAAAAAAAAAADEVQSAAFRGILNHRRRVVEPGGGGVVEYKVRYRDKARADGWVAERHVSAAQVAKFEAKKRAKAAAPQQQQA